MSTQGQQAERRGQLEQLLEILIDKSKESNSTSFSLLTGRAGQLLFLYEAAKHPICRIDLDWLSNEISVFISNAHAVIPDWSMASGMAGIAWFYQYVLQDQNQIDDQNKAIDRWFSELLSVDEWQGEYEYVLGIVGLAPYLSRRTHTSEGKSNALAFVKHCAKLAVVENGLAFWPTPLGSAFRVNKTISESVEINLGLAHGNIGVLAALLALSKEPSVAQSARPLITAACNWLVRQRQDVSLLNSHFSYVYKSQIKSRLGWCYGDLTIALTLARAGKFLEQPSYTELASTIALDSARRDAEDAQIFDAGLCHGSSGLVLIFRLLYIELNHPELLAAATFWQNFYLNHYKQHGILALNKHRSEIEEGNITTCEDFGLLEGYAGIGLGILVSLGQDPEWVDALLLA